MTDLLPTLAVLILCILVASRYVRRFRPDERSLLWLSFAAHQLAGVLNIWVTKYYYTYGDMLNYHEFGVVAADSLRADFWGLAPGLVRLIFHDTTPLPIPLETFNASTGTMQGVSAFAMYLLFDSLYAACALIAGAAFLSKVALYRVVSEELPEVHRRALIFACTFLPSALFWSCSLLKEPLAMIGVLPVIFGWHQWVNHRRRLRAFVLMAVGSCIVLLTKSYIFPALVLAIAAWQFARKAQEGRGDIAFRAGHAITVAAAAGVLVLVTGALLPQFAPDALSDQLAGLQTVGAEVEGGSGYTLGQKSGSSSAQAVLAPFGLVTALFRPVIPEVKSAIMLPSAFEMTFFIVGTILVFVRRGVMASLTHLFRRPFLCFCAMFVLVFGTCVGLGTTNLGTLSRYRMPLIPFFAMLLMALIGRARVPVDVRRPVLQAPSVGNT